MEYKNEWKKRGNEKKIITVNELVKEKKIRKNMKRNKRKEKKQRKITKAGRKKQNKQQYKYLSAITTTNK